jgi:hypothetical protein
MSRAALGHNAGNPGNIPLKETSYDKTRSHFDGRYVRTGTDCIVCQRSNSATRCGKHAGTA